jgi:hypothetical protein
MSQFQDFYDKADFLGAGCSQSKTICFSEAFYFLTNDYQKRHRDFCIHDQGKRKVLGFPRGEVLWVVVI